MPSLPLPRLTGAPPALPPLLDRASERWWRCSPRQRLASLLALALLGLAAGIGQAAASPWGPPVTVHLASRDLAVGEVLTTSDTRRGSWPRDLVPPQAVTAPQPGATIVAPLPAGSVLTDAHLGEGGLHTLLRPGYAAVALDVEVLPGADPGLRLDLVGVDVEGRGVTLAQDATVLLVDAGQLWVEVPRAVAGPVAAATRTGALAVVVVSG